MKLRDAEPRDHREAVAHFRLGVIGPLLVAGELERGQLAEALRELAAQRYRPPGSPVTRRYGFSTIERWYYAFRRGGIDALMPALRADRGAGRKLRPELIELLLDIRRENPTVSTPIILRTLVADGRLEPDTTSASVVNRLYRQHGLDRKTLRTQGRQRLRWETATPGSLWHADVCHGDDIVVDGRKRPLRIHALLDDNARYIVAIWAHHSEREVEMLELLARALRRHGAPCALYLDNGSTYRGKALSLVCSRLEINLIHARPYDPQARGKMERFWRTLREGCLDHLGSASSLHDVNVRLWAFVDQHYHRAPHGGLLGRSPAQRWTRSTARPVTEDQLADAYTVRQRRRIRKDSTLTIDGDLWQLDQGFLAGKTVTVARTLVVSSRAPWVEYRGERYDLSPVDPVANASKPRQRPAAPATDEPTRPFDPATALLDKAAGRTSGKGGQR
ncbi:MAG: DDE-type integrase/transposase/recombinase [Thermoanaerobaculia bacterium]|nr:DDE-type integrase/transposase/recombinase [Thermoanaerobaculia bacterium]